MGRWRLEDCKEESAVTLKLSALNHQLSGRENGRPENKEMRITGINGILFYDSC